MATIPRETISPALPRAGRGDLLLGAAAVLLALLAIIAKVTGFFG
jgi:hypothetical protein